MPSNIGSAEQSGQEGGAASRSGASLPEPADTGRPGTSRLAFSLLVTEDGEQRCTVPLSYDQVAGLVREFADTPANADLFRLLARHPAARVRESVADKRKLPEDVLAMLAGDPSPDVLRSLVGSEAFVAWATAQTLLAFIARDPQLASSIADSLGAFEVGNTAEVLEALLRHPDPSVPERLAGGYGVPKKIVRALSKHPDPGVAEKARDHLE